MTSYLVDAVLLVALVATSWRVGQTYRELKRMQALQAQYQLALEASVAALERVKATVERVRADSAASSGAPAPADPQGGEAFAGLEPFRPLKIASAR